MAAGRFLTSVSRQFCFCRRLLFSPPGGAVTRRESSNFILVERLRDILFEVPQYLHNDFIMTVFFFESHKRHQVQVHGEPAHPESPRSVSPLKASAADWQNGHPFQAHEEWSCPSVRSIKRNHPKKSTIPATCFPKPTQLFKAQ